MRSGANTLGAELGRGFYGMTGGNVWRWESPPWHDEPVVRARLRIEYTDGRVQDVITDANWQIADGPTVFDDLYAGETYDARKVQDGYDTAGFDDATWAPASEVRGPQGVLVDQRQQPIRVTESLPASQVTQPAAGVWVVKFPRVLAGWVEITAQAPAGSNRVIFTPWLNGERTPVDDHTIRGGWDNLSLTTTRADLVRSVFEGVAYNSRWLLDTVESFVKRPLDGLNFIGGGAQSDLWCQMHADVCDRVIRRVAEQITAGGGRAIALTADVSDEESVSAAITQAATQLGGLHVVFANAGINGMQTPIDEMTLDEWNATIGPNLTGVFLTVKHSIPHMRAGGGGSIIITASVNGNTLFSLPGY